MDMHSFRLSQLNCSVTVNAVEVSPWKIAEVPGYSDRSEDSNLLIDLGKRVLQHELEESGLFVELERLADFVRDDLAVAGARIIRGYAIIAGGARDEARGAKGQLGHGSQAEWRVVGTPRVEDVGTVVRITAHVTPC